MDKRFLVLQHVDVEHPGVFRQFMHEEGIEWDMVELDAGESLPNHEAYDALIVMGGPMDVWEEAEHPWLTAEKAFINRWVKQHGKPYLGICLGHQLLAAALGAVVAKAEVAEVGVMAVDLTEAGLAHPFMHKVPATISCLQWHGAEVRQHPSGSQILASSEHCAIQSLAIGNHAFSFQFHIEVIPSTVDDWYAIPAYQHSLTAVLGPHGVDAFRQQTNEQMDEFNKLARQIYNNWRATAFG